MYTIISRVFAYDIYNHSSSIHDERIIGLFPTLQEAKESALRMAQSIFDKAYEATLESTPKEDQDLPDMDVGEVGVSVHHLTNPQEASRYRADYITHHFLIREIE